MDPGQDHTTSAPVAEVDAEIGYEPSPFPFLQAPLASSIFRDAREPVFRPGGEDVRRWQEEEFQRKLRGEYEVAQRRIGEVVNESLEHPLHISSVRLSPPLQHTRPGFLSSLISPFISSPNSYSWTPAALNPANGIPTPPESLQEVLMTTKALVNHLRRFDIFAEPIDVRLEPARGGALGDVDLVLGLREKGRLFLKAGTEVGGGEGGANITGRLRNLFGGAETLEMNASYGTKTKSSYQATLATPLLASPLLNFAVSAFAMERDNSHFASHKERAQGLRARLSAIAPWGSHDLAYEYVNREIGGLTPKASLRNTLACPVAAHPPTSLKVPPSRNSPGSCVLVPISSWAARELPDRIFLGGPNSVRGWRIGGMGAHDGGGDLAFALGLSLLAPVPKKPEWPIKLHSFLNIGRLISWDHERSLADSIGKLYTQPDVSIGAGLIYRLDPVRVEVNFSLPLIGRKNESWSRGLGVGLGLEFL